MSEKYRHRSSNRYVLSKNGIPLPVQINAITTESTFSDCGTGQTDPNKPNGTHVHCLQSAFLLFRSKDEDC